MLLVYGTVLCSNYAIRCAWTIFKFRSFYIENTLLLRKKAVGDFCDFHPTTLESPCRRYAVPKNDMVVSGQRRMIEKNRTSVSTINLHLRANFQVQTRT